MENKLVQGIPLMDFGNKIVIRGILFANDETEKGWIAVLPQKVLPDNVLINQITPTLEEWHDIP